MRKAFITNTFLIALLVASSVFAAPVRWVGNGHLYDVILVPEGITWTDANVAAQARGSGWHLATITSAEENAFVANLASNPVFWICCSSNNAGGPWLGGFKVGPRVGDYAWVTGEPFVYTKWGPLEPFGNGDRLAFFGYQAPTGSTWNDVRATTLARAYIIENQATAGSVSPSSGGDTGSVTVWITGNGFMAGATVKLSRDGEPDVVGDPVTMAEDGQSITTTFDLAGKARGLWDVVVMNPDGSSTRISKGFTIEEGRAAQLWVDIVGRGAIRAGREQTYWILYGNHGNIDEDEERVVVLGWPAEADLSVVGATSAYGEPLPPPILEGPKKALGIFIPRLKAGTILSIPVRFVVHGPILQATIEAASLSGASVSGSDATLRSPPQVENTGSPPPGSTVFMGPHGDNPFGHEAIVDDQNGQAVVWDLWLARKRPNISQPIPFDQWESTVGGQYLGWGTPPGWTSEKGEYAAQEAERLIKEGEVPWVLEWGAKSDDGYTCSSFIEHLYEQAGLDPVPFPFDPLSLTPGLHYRWFTGKKDFYSSGEDLFDIARPLFKLNAWSDFLDGALIDYLRKSHPYRDSTSRVVTSFDPNDKIGSQGAGVGHYLTSEEPLRYAVFFENVETATAPAQEVIVTDQLDTTKMDLDTLSLGPISFGDTIVTPPPGLNAFTTTVDLRPDKNLLVKIEASLDKSTGLLTWRLTSIDPTTGEPPEDPLAGFLPPNITPPEGDGSVLFTVMPKQGLPTGTEIRNQAQIVFDVNPPINTPEWLNTLDNTQPTSQVLVLAATQTSANFLVEWAGTDVGAGIQDYKIFVAENGGPFSTWLSNTPDTSGTFPGQTGKTYAFYSIAKDQTGNLEDVPQAADTTTTVTTITDLCPEDPNKTAPGVCGCGVADTDSDGDGTPNCNDQCPNDPNRTTPGIEVCNGSDDNCNGTVDDGFNVGASCTAGVGACQRTGAFVCSANGQGTQCNVIAGTPSTEVCNGSDDDCDGAIDEGVCAPVCAANVSAQVSVTRGGFRRNSATGRYVQQITLKNTGTTAIQGPVSLTLDSLSSNATLFSPTGNTSCATPVSPYKNVNVGADNALSVGETVTIVLEFTNPTNASITYGTRVLGGPNDR